MNLQRSFRWTSLSTACLTLAFAFSLVQAQTGPAQESLISRGAAVKPNIVMIFDDSGSMRAGCVYAPHVAPTINKDELDSAYPGVCLADVSQRRHNAPANNLLMYDPAKRYVPAYDDAGVQLSNAALGNASLTISLPKAGVILSNYKTKSDLESSSRYDTLTIASDRITLNTVVSKTVSPIPKGAGRSDCGGANCTLAEERQNVANWRAWHATRLAAAKTGIGKAFEPQPDSFRLGWSTLTSKIAGVKDFGLSRGQFYTWLNDITADGGTPLRRALDDVGRYYLKDDKAGPWAHTPWAPGTETAASHLSCRRSYAILMTDGLWNEDNGTVTSDVDGSSGKIIVHLDASVSSYQYKPLSPDARSLGKADVIGNKGAGYAATLSDVAMNYWVTDLRPDLPNNTSKGRPSDPAFWQNMTTYAISFGAYGKMSATDVDNARRGLQNWEKPVSDTVTALDDLIHAAHNGGGKFMNVSDAEAFGVELGRTLSSISNQQSSEAGVATSSSSLSTNSRKFVPYFAANLWWGNLKMVSLDANTGAESSVVWQVVETDVEGRPTGASTIPPHDQRNIWVWANATAHAVPFTWASLNSNTLIAATASSTAPNMLNGSATEAMVNYLRGDRANEGDTAAFRVRQAVLGDIVNTTPVFVKSSISVAYEKLPAGNAALEKWAAYLAMKGQRAEGVLFVGANDGMLHGFREGANGINGGKETFAYVPRAVLPNMHNLAAKAYKHQYFVDGPLTEADAWIATPSKAAAWTNMVLGTAGAGGKAVFALDATNPLAMNGNNVLWEVSSSDPDFKTLGHVLSPVQTGVMKDGTWVAIFGNGYYNTPGKAGLYIVNLATGAFVKYIDTPAFTGDVSNGLGGVRLVRNANQQIIGAYAGDLNGRVWTFDLSGSAASSWKLGLNNVPLFVAKDSAGIAQPITAMPAVTLRTDIPTANPSYMVVVGTGKLFDTADPANTRQQAVYGLWDTQGFGQAGAATANTATASSQLVSLSLAKASEGFYKVNAPRAINWATDRGWSLPLSLAAGQRLVYPVESLGGLVRVDTVVPPATSVQSCSDASGTAYNFIINPVTGMCREKGTLDVNGDSTIDMNDGNACGYSTVADGEDVVLTIAGAAGDSGTVVSVQGAGGQRSVRIDDTLPVKPADGSFKSRAWRQIFLRKP